MKTAFIWLMVWEFPLIETPHLRMVCVCSATVIFKYPSLPDPEELSLGLGKGFMEMNLWIFRGQLMRVKLEYEDF